MSNPDTPQPTPTVRSAPIPRDRCGMALACDLLGERWTMLLVREAFYGVSRFDDLRTDLGIPRGILSTRLAKLVADGILEKHPYREGSSRTRYEYRLSDRGRELGLALLALMQWGDRHLQDTPSPLSIRDRRSGKPLVVALVTPDGRAVSAEDVQVEVEAVADAAAAPSEEDAAPRARASKKAVRGKTGTRRAGK